MVDDCDEFLCNALDSNDQAFLRFQSPNEVLLRFLNEKRRCDDLSIDDFREILGQAICVSRGNADKWHGSDEACPAVMRQAMFAMIKQLQRLRPDLALDLDSQLHRSCLE